MSTFGFNLPGKPQTGCFGTNGKVGTAGNGGVQDGAASTGGVQGAPQAGGGDDTAAQVAALVNAIRYRTKRVDEIKAGLEALGITVTMTQNKLGNTVFEFSYGETDYKLTYGTGKISSANIFNGIVQPITIEPKINILNNTPIINDIVPGGDIVIDDVIPGSTKNYEKDLKNLKNLLDDIKADKADIDSLKEQLEDYKTKYSDNSDAMNKLKDVYDDFKSRYADDIISGKEKDSNSDEILDAFSDYIDESFDEQLQDLLDKLKDELDNIGNEELNDIVDIYFDGSDLTDSELEDIKNMLLDAIDTDNYSNDELTDEDIDALEKDILDTYSQYSTAKSEAEVLINRINEVMKMLNKLLQAAKSENVAPDYSAIIDTIQTLLDDIKEWINKNAQVSSSGFSNSMNKMAKDLGNALFGINSGINNFKNDSGNITTKSDDDSIEELNDMQEYISNLAILLATIKFEDLIDNLTSALFTGRDSVSTDELFEWLDNHYGSGNKEKYLDGDDVIDAENGTFDTNITLGSGNDSIGKTLRAMGIADEDSVINAITGEINDVCDALEINISDISISYYTLESKLREKFAGKTSVTKEEVLNAIRNIFIEEAYKIYTDRLSTKENYDDDTLSDTFSDTIKSIVGNINIDENTSIKQISDLTYMITNIVRLFGMLREAISHGYTAEALNIINQLQEALDSLQEKLDKEFQNYANNYDHETKPGGDIDGGSDNDTDLKQDYDSAINNLKDWLEQYKKQEIKKF